MNEKSGCRLKENKGKGNNYCDNLLQTIYKNLFYFPRMILEGIMNCGCDTSTKRNMLDIMEVGVGSTGIFVSPDLTKKFLSEVGDARDELRKSFVEVGVNVSELVESNTRIDIALNFHGFLQIFNECYLTYSKIEGLILFCKSCDSSGNKDVFISLQTENRNKFLKTIQKMLGVYGNDGAKAYIIMPDSSALDGSFYYNEKNKLVGFGAERSEINFDIKKLIPRYDVISESKLIEIILGNTDSFDIPSFYPDKREFLVPTEIDGRLGHLLSINRNCESKQCYRYTVNIAMLLNNENKNCFTKTNSEHELGIKFQSGKNINTNFIPNSREVIGIYDFGSLVKIEGEIRLAPEDIETFNEAILYMENKVFSLRR